jgi:hypothetical protein
MYFDANPPKLLKEAN